MWDKFNVASYKIPSYFNSGFSIDIKNNWIINTEKNYKIKLPFKVNTKNEIYYFELLTTNSFVTLTLIINIDLISALLDLNSRIPHKNNLFKILKSSYNQDPIIYNFNKYNGIKNIINNNYLNLSKTISIGNIYFNLVSEQIYKENNKNKEKKNCKIYFLFGKFQNLNIANRKICIIDDYYKLINKITISKNNYKQLNKKYYIDNNLINLDSSLFFSKEYISEYKKFHNNSKSRYAYENYKNHVNSQDLSYPIFNIELFDNFIIILKGQTFENNISKFINHPILFSNNHIFVINSKITSSLIKSCEKILKKTSKIYQIDYKNIANNHIYLDKNKYLLYSKYKDKETCTFFRYLSNKFSIFFNIFNNKIDLVCPVNKIDIDCQTHVKFDCKCNNSFIYDNLWNYLAKSNICPYCRNNITKLNIYINKNNILKNLFGEKINLYLEDRYKLLYVYKNSNKITKFITYCKKNFFNLENIQLYSLSESPIIEINDNTILLLENTISFYDCLNLFNNSEVRKIKKIIKFSLFI